MELSLEAGLTPMDPFTPREMFILAERVQQSKWDHTAQITAAIINSMRAKGKPKSAEEFNPIRASSKNRKQDALKNLSIKEAVEILRSAEL